MLISGHAKRIQSRVDLIDVTDLLALGEVAARDIVDTIDHGQGVDGRALPDYQSGERRGRRVTLRRTGRLLSSIHAVRVTDRRIAVRSTARYARHVARRFQIFGLTPVAQDRIAEVLFRRVGDRFDASARRGLS